MLKRYQVLLPDWLESYVKHLVGLYGLSFSEIIRVQICLATLLGMSHFYPEHHLDLDFEKMLDVELLQNVDQLPREEIKRRVSKIYFETRKAIEFRIEVESTKTGSKD